MATIRKKLWPQFFEPVQSGKKKYELRLNDFEIAEGDTLILEEWDPETQSYTGRTIEKKVTYIGRFKVNELPYWSPEDIAEKGLQIISIE